MKKFNYKSIWLFFALVILVITTVCYFNISREEKKVFANGRIVQVQPINEETDLI